MQVAGKTYSSDTRQRRGHGMREGAPIVAPGPSAASSREAAGLQLVCLP